MKIRIPLLVAAALCLGALAWADMHEGAGEYDKDAMWEEMMKLAEPGDAHAFLGKLAGQWKTVVTHYEMGELSGDPDEGTATFKVLMGGRVVRGDHKAQMMGMPFEGMSLDGYDNLSGQYWSTWIDNMGTAIMVAHGKKVDDKTLEHVGTMQSPMGEHSMRFTTTVGKNNATMKMYMSMPGSDEEHLSMTVEYTRVSS